MQEFEIVTVRSGANSIRSLENGETFHPVTGPWWEANVLHVEQQRLVERCKNSKKFVIWDVGLGAAANVLAAIEAIRHLDTEIEIHSFDRTTSPLEFALAHAEELVYPAPHKENLRQLLDEKRTKVSPNLHWHLHLGDFRELVKSLKISKPNAIFYDPYSVTSNPEMWLFDHFRALRDQMGDEPCLLTNYTCSTSVRVTLLMAGFFVGVGRSIGIKAETTIASNCLELLPEPLGKVWLKRVRSSTNAAPMRTVGGEKSTISAADLEQIEQSPQFLF